MEIAGETDRVVMGWWTRPPAEVRDKSHAWAHLESGTGEGEYSLVVTWALSQTSWVQTRASQFTQ